MNKAKLFRGIKHRRLIVYIISLGFPILKCCFLGWVVLSENMNTNESKNGLNFCSDSTEQRILVGLSKISLALKSQAWQDAGQQGLSPTQAQILSEFASGMS